MYIPFKQFMEVQYHRIEIEKWYEGEQTHCDPGNEFITKWIENNADLFKIKYNISLCKSCKKWKECGYKILTKCNEYELLK